MTALPETKKEVEEFSETMNKVLEEEYNLQINLNKTKNGQYNKEQSRCKVKVGNVILNEVKE